MSDHLTLVEPRRNGAESPVLLNWVTESLSSDAARGDSLVMGIVIPSSSSTHLS